MTCGGTVALRRFAMRPWRRAAAGCGRSC